VEDLILSLRNHYTVVVVTHNLSQARRISDQLVLFWVQEGSGCLIESGPTQQLFDNPQKELTAAYINGMRG
jgi:phosphate transport system ATP-binding protein